MVLGVCRLVWFMFGLLVFNFPILVTLVLRGCLGCLCLWFGVCCLGLGLVTVISLFGVVWWLGWEFAL